MLRIYFYKLTADTDGRWRFDTLDLIVEKGVGAIVVPVRFVLCGQAGQSWQTLLPNPAAPIAVSAVRDQKTLARLKIAETAAAEGITPLEVMLRTMRALWDQDTAEAKLQAC